uniref:Uncharacterized protein n=1 Tax=Anguilla anguilla TaxID=7936 RepID=A0A0E9RR98_ANGAN
MRVTDRKLNKVECDEVYCKVSDLEFCT